MFLAWRYGNEDPYRVYNGLDRQYRPLSQPDQLARPPTYPTRLRHFVYGCGLYAMDNEGKLAGQRQQTRVAKAMGG